VNCRISLVLATYNRAAALDRVLACVENQSLSDDAFEVLVCVDGSKDHTRDVLDAWTARARFSLTAIYQENQGQSAARHHAIEKASGARVVVVDDDMELCPEFLEQHLRAAEDDPEHLIIIGKVVPEEGWRRKPLYEVIREDGQLRLHERLESRAQVPTATSFVTQNVSMPRRLYLDVGGFDQSLRLFEDAELGMRFERAGAKMRFSPGARAVHRSDIGSYEKWEKRQYEYGRYAVQVWEKYGKDPYLHPLRNFVNGHPANRAAVNLLSRWDWTARGGSRLLRRLGTTLAKAGLLEPGLATHKAILAVQYHLGVKHSLGSWAAFRSSAETFRRNPDRPEGPTGTGPTHKG
jgi:glycosyltransferase involved in cell wall biosynthesis